MQQASSSSSATPSPGNIAPPPTRIIGPVGGGTLALQAVHGPSGCSTERPPGSNVRMCIGQVLAMSTVNGTLPAHCNLLHYHSILGAAFYMLPHIGLGAAIIADPVHMVSPPMGIIIILQNKPLSTFKL